VEGSAAEWERSSIERREVSFIVKDSEIDLEKALDDLENIVEALESGKLSLEGSLELFERGIKLIKLCNARLDSAEKRIESLAGELPSDLDG
jgi:exodeoxyribonuclease VII small subunit